MVTFLILLLIHSFPSDGQTCLFNSHKDVADSIWMNIDKKCTGQKVHLTFDDGPSEITSEIVRELNRRQVKATFFVTTTQLQNKNGSLNLPKAQIVKLAFDSGHLIGSHGHQHKAYDLRYDKNGIKLEEPFSKKNREEEINLSLKLLNLSLNEKFSQQSLILFRFPYGRGAKPSAFELNLMEKNGMQFMTQTFTERLKEYYKLSPALQALGEFGFSHLGWNHDSGDSSIQSIEEMGIEKYIKENIERLCHASSTRVALFHDVKFMNTIAIPIMIDIGKCLGLKFIDAKQMSEDSSVLSSDTLITNKKIKSSSLAYAEETFKEVDAVLKGEKTYTASEESVYPYVFFQKNENSPSGHKCYIYCHADISQNPIVRIYQDYEMKKIIKTYGECKALISQECKFHSQSF